MHSTLLPLLFLSTLLPLSARADLSLCPLFSDHAVLQQGRAVPVWGRAAPGERVTVSFRGQIISATAGPDGRWIVYLDALAPSSVPAELVVAGKNTVRAEDVLVGEVWLCAGQSNMEFTLNWGVLDQEKEIAAADHPLIRQFKVERAVADQPAGELKGHWEICSPRTAGEFTAVGYFFGRDLQARLGGAVGLINDTWGGTEIEAWLSAAALKSTAVYPQIEARWQKNLAEFPARQAAYPAEAAAWEKGEARAKATGKPNPAPWPVAPIGPGTPYAPSGLFNGMIAPVQPYGIRGALWYQGESNVGRAGQYGPLLTALIRSWRENWGEGDFPFYFVQLPNFNDPGDSSRQAWAWLRAAQAQALALPETAMAVTIDIGESDNLHPKNKQEIGRRLALIARAKIYGIPGDWSGPVYRSCARAGAALRVQFDHAQEGLIAHDRPPQALEIAGADRKFYPATGRIEGDTLLVSSPRAPAPVAVRYAWSDNPGANLFNGAGLPAAPFRSDDWP